MVAIALINSGAGDFGNEEMIGHHLDSLYCGNTGEEFKWSVDKRPQIFSFSALPKDRLLHEWFNHNGEQFARLHQSIRSSAEAYADANVTMRRDGDAVVWWPFTQHQLVAKEDVNFIESCSGDYYKVLKTPPVQDAGILDDFAMCSFLILIYSHFMFDMCSAKNACKLCRYVRWEC